MTRLPRLAIPKDAWPRLRSERATRTVLVALYALVLLVVVFEVARSLHRVDKVIFTGYTRVGAVVLQGSGDPYGLPNTWPPFFLFVAAGLALAAGVSLRGALLVWQLGSVLAVWGSCKLLARFLDDDGGTLTFWPRTSDRLAFVSAGVLVPFLFTARLFQENLQHTQINAYLLYLVLLAFHLFRERRPAAGGFALALAASTKAVPVLLVLYLAYKRCWRAVVWTVGLLLLLNVAVPVAVFGPGEAAARWRTWRAVAAVQTADPTPQYPNQSLLAGLKRLFTVEGGARDPVRYAVAAWSPQAVQRLFAVLAGLGAAGLAVLFRKRSPPLPPGTLRDRGAAAEYAICLGAMTLVSPLAWKAHYVMLLAPCFFVWWALRGRPASRVAWAVWWGSFVCLTLSGPALVGERLNNALESLNVITVGAVLVLGLAVWLLPRAYAATATHSSQ